MDELDKGKECELGGKQGGEGEGNRGAGKPYVFTRNTKQFEFTLIPMVSLQGPGHAKHAL